MLQEQKGLSQGFRPLFLDSITTRFHMGMILAWRCWSAVCCGREAVSSSCQENFAVPHLLLPSGYSGESRKTLMPLKSMISLWDLRQAPWEQEGSQPVKEAARHYRTGWRYRFTSRNQQAEEERLYFIFSSSSHNNPVRKTPSLGWVTSGWIVAQTHKGLHPSQTPDLQPWCHRRGSELILQRRWDSWGCFHP